MPQVLARHQHAARRRADRRAAVVLREPHPLRREPIDIRRGDLLLPIAAQLAPAKIVGQDEDDVEFRRSVGYTRRRLGGQQAFITGTTKC